jgi:acyl-CoA thioesterase FadM
MVIFMGRVKIKFPDDKSLHTAIIPVRINDINYGGHLGNDAVLSLIHEARMQLLYNWGYDELNAGGNSLIMADVMIAYKAEAYYGDILTIKMYADEINERSFDILYHINTYRNNETINIAHAKTGMVCYDYKMKKIGLMTENLKRRLAGKIE